MGNNLNGIDIMTVNKEASKTSSNKPVFITCEPVMKNLYEKVKLVARSQAPVFITGESGTGKDVIARLLHYHGPRSKKPFFAINCAAFSTNLVESELFGHEKGSFTGALNTKKGCFEYADQGVLFLDEIAEMSPKIQVKLLRVAEMKNFRRVGGNQEIQTDVQIISATNQDVSELMNTGKFREDLYYRLNVIELKIPPLRERRKDIPLLSNFFLSEFTDEHCQSIKRFSDECIKLFMNYDWPGNVRELRNVVERCTVMCQDEVIHTDHLPKTFDTNGYAHSAPEIHNGQNKDNANGHYQIPVGSTIEHAERIIINQTLSFTDHNKSEAARILGVSRNTLHNKLSKYSDLIK